MMSRTRSIWIVLAVLAVGSSVAGAQQQSCVPCSTANHGKDARQPRMPSEPMPTPGTPGTPGSGTSKCPWSWDYMPGPTLPELPDDTEAEGTDNYAFVGTDAVGPVISATLDGSVLNDSASSTSWANDNRIFIFFDEISDCTCNQIEVLATVTYAVQLAMSVSPRALPGSSCHIQATNHHDSTHTNVHLRADVDVAQGVSFGQTGSVTIGGSAGVSGHGLGVTFGVGGIPVGHSPPPFSYVARAQAAGHAKGRRDTMLSGGSIVGNIMIANDSNSTGTTTVMGGISNYILSFLYTGICSVCSTRDQHEIRLNC